MGLGDLVCFKFSSSMHATNSKYHHLVPLQSHYHQQLNHWLIKANTNWPLGNCGCSKSIWRMLNELCSLAFIICSLWGVVAVCLRGRTLDKITIVMCMTVNSCTFWNHANTAPVVVSKTKRYHYALYRKSL